MTEPAMVVNRNKPRFTAGLLLLSLSFSAAFATWWSARPLVRRAQRDIRVMDDTWDGLRRVHTLAVPMTAL